MSKKIIREVDKVRGIHQITIADERWYMKPIKNEASDIPEYLAVPSVTWIAQSYPKGIGYYKWLAEKGWDEAEAVKTAAGDKGSKVHLAIEQILLGNEVRIDSKFINKSTERDEELSIEEVEAIMSFIDWKKDTEKDWIIETLASEITVFSEFNNYAGTVDWIVKLTHRTTGEVRILLIDFKTSQFVWPSHGIQVNAYKESITNGENEVTGIPPDFDLSKIEMGILQVGYQKNKARWKFTVIEDDFDMFLTVQKIWKKEHDGEQPARRDYPIILSPQISKLDVQPDDVDVVPVEEMMPKVTKKSKTNV